MKIQYLIVGVVAGVGLVLSIQEVSSMLRSKSKKPKSVLPVKESVTILPKDTELVIPKLHKNAEKVLKIAGKYDWKFLEYQKPNRMISFLKNKDRINFYCTTGTVGTCIHHPKSGKTQLFRKGVSDEQLEKIFENPRIHTGVGYHKKHKN